jgi:bifunctional DNA-binding transcriptional regulator/antitoxin component of YhaV-PrlF toxin-antitoxin module
MHTAVTKRGQTVIPAALRKRYQIGAGVHLVWLDDGETIRVIPVPDDPIPSLRGRGRGQKTTERLLAERKKDRNREESI